MTPRPNVYDIDISIIERRWHSVDALEPHVMAALMAARDELGAPQAGELSIALIDDAHIKQLNHDYRGRDKPTNVLSFPSNGPAAIMGDIALAYETILREAQEKNIAITAHLQHLVIHGYLHLSGFDHETDDDAARMEAIEIAALARIGLANPYETMNA